MKVRTGNQTDIAIGLVYADRGWFDYLHEFDGIGYDHIYAAIEDHMANATGGLWVAEDKEKVVGMLGWSVEKDQYNPNNDYLCENFWAVIETYKNSTAAYKLLQAFVDMSEDAELPIQMTLGRKSTPASLALLCQYGFNITEYTLERKVDHGKENNKNV